jgi:hypothetical protein
LELGDTYAGGAVGWKPDDKNEGFGMSAERQQGGDVKNGSGWPLPKSLSLIPETVRFTMVYGHNPHTQRETQQWRLRNVVRWCRPNPPVGALGDKYRPATTELMIFAKNSRRYFDLDAVRSGPNDRTHELSSRSPKYADGANLGMSAATGSGLQHPAGAPPLDYWEIPTQPYKGAHYATWPTRLLEIPLKSMVPRRVCVVCGKPSTRITETDRELAAKQKLARQGLPNDRGLNVSPVGGRVDKEVGGFGRRTVVSESWSDCQHNQWRNGTVLDPFAGTGTTLTTATGHGLNAIGIDLDPRNQALAEQRIGMFLTVIT